jgi:hypothetical protein
MTADGDAQPNGYIRTPASSRVRRFERNALSAVYAVVSSDNDGVASCKTPKSHLSRTVLSRSLTKPPQKIGALVPEIALLFELSDLIHDHCYPGRCKS